MDNIDAEICRMIQDSGRISNAEIGQALNISVSTASERVRRLTANGTITRWSAVLDPNVLGAAFCGFVFVDTSYDGEAEAVAALTARPEVQELHHISGAHSYLMKLRVADTAAMQAFLQDHVKPLAGVLRTETLIALETCKETSSVAIAPANPKE